MVRKENGDGRSYERRVEQRYLCLHFFSLCSKRAYFLFLKFYFRSSLPSANFFSDEDKDDLSMLEKSLAGTNPTSNDTDEDGLRDL